MSRKINISNSEFVHWHCHSEYSSFDGLAGLTELCYTARHMGFPALAITDHGNVGSWIKFINECQTEKDKEGNDIDAPPIKPILGMEAYLCHNHKHKSKKEAKANGGYQKEGKKGNRHLNLYAMNWKGYQNLCSLSQKGYVEGQFYGDPRIDFEQLHQHREGLMCGSACLSSVVNANLLHNQYGQAKKACSIFKDLFGENFFLEVMYHGIREESLIIPDILRLSKELGIPVVPSNDSHYINKSDAKTQEVLMCMSSSRCLNDPSHIKFPYDEFYLKSAEEMHRIFSEIPQAFNNSLALMERIETEDITSNLFGGMRLPDFKIPDKYESSYDYLVDLAKQGLKDLGWGQSKPHIDALKKELRDIKAAWDNHGYDFSTYFLVVQDYMNYAHQEGIVTGPGRGSGYGSVLLRCLGITHGVDPLEYNLLFERFLGFKSSRFIQPSDFGL